MPAIPRSARWDDTVSLVRDPYGFISATCRSLGSDLFATRLLLAPAICMLGKEAAELFYDSDRFRREGAAPLRLQLTLFGKGGVQGLDDDEHRHRKQLFMSLVTPERVEDLVKRTRVEWSRQFPTANAEETTLYEVSRRVLCQSVCDWAGVPLTHEERDQRTRELTALFEFAGAIGPPNWWSKLARQKCDAWAADIVERIRNGELRPPETSAAVAIATHRDLRGERLPLKVAAVELLNVLRPVVAVSVYITQAATALSEFPACREAIAARQPQYDQWFAQEVRRYYPFFPAVAAAVRRDFDWKGFRFPEGRRVLLDLYGTNHDPRIWDAPDWFKPERFADLEPRPFEFIPQGGGEAHRQHRCPGEGIAIELIKSSVEFLVHEAEYALPKQDLTIDRQKLPALPRSRLRIRPGPSADAGRAEAI